LKLLKTTKRIYWQKTSTKLLPQNNKTSNPTQNSQAGRRRFDPGRPLQNSLLKIHRVSIRNFSSFWPKQQKVFKTFPSQKQLRSGQSIELSFTDIMALAS
jgi:hypothetical protein